MSKKKRTRTVLIIIAALLAAICIAQSFLTLTLFKQTEYPSEVHKFIDDAYPDEEHFFLFAVPIEPSIDIPFTINNVELRDVNGGSTAELSKLLICEHNDYGLQPGVRYCSIKELQDQFEKMTPFEEGKNYRVKSLPVDIFIMTPGEIATSRPTYELIVTYSWLGIFRHTATLTIE